MRACRSETIGAHVKQFELVPFTPNQEFEQNTKDEVLEVVVRCNIANVQAARRLLYISHVFAQFSEVAWQFCLALFLAACTDYQSMILVSAYGIVAGLSVFLLGPHLGSYIDATDRLTLARRLIFCENLSVLVATAFCYVLLTSPHPRGVVLESNTNSWSKESRLAHVPTDTISLICLVAINILGSVAQVMDQAFLVAIERDWVVVLCRTAAALSTTSDNVEEQEAIFHGCLSKTNVTMKQIDLGCKVAAPAIAGFLIPLVSSFSQSSLTNTTSNDAAGEQGDNFTWPCVVLGALNVAALFTEYICTVRIYQLIPDLANKEASICSAIPYESSSTTSSESTNIDTVYSHCKPRGLQIYMEQASAMGGFALSMLYVNSLTMGNGIMTTYLLYRGIDLQLVGILRGIASAIGLLGTVVYHCSARYLTLEMTGLWSISYQFGCLLLAFFSLSIVNDSVALSLLIGCICFSRIGLWVFDIAVTQLQQQEVPDHLRGRVGGVQSSLNSGFNLLSFVLGIVFPNPRDFAIYVFAGVLGVGTAAILYLFGIFLPRRHTTAVL